MKKEGGQTIIDVHNHYVPEKIARASGVTEGKPVIVKEDGIPKRMIPVECAFERVPVYKELLGQGNDIKIIGFSTLLQD